MEKKSSKGSVESASSKPILKDTTLLFSLNPLDYNENLCVILEYISHHLTTIPLSKETNPKFPFRSLLKSFKIMKFKGDILETHLKDYRIVPVIKEIFLKAVWVSPNIEAFTVIEPTIKEFQDFLT